MRTMTGTEFRANWQAVFIEIATTGERAIITRWGKPFLQLESAGYQSISQTFPLESERIPCIAVTWPVGRCV